MKQKRMDRLVAALPQAIAAGEETLVSWVGDFALLSDEGCTYDPRPIVEQLTQAGYRPTRQEAFARDRVTLEANGKEAYRRRLVHFAFHFLDSNLPVPENATIYANYYFERTGVTRNRLW